MTGSVTQRSPEEVFIDGLSVPVYLSHEPDVAPDPGAAHLASVAWPGLAWPHIIIDHNRPGAGTLTPRLSYSTHVHLRRGDLYFEESYFRLNI